MKSSLLKAVLTDQLESYPADHSKVNNGDGDHYSIRPSEESFLVELDNKLFDELLNLEKLYPLTIHIIDNNTIIITPLPGNVSYNIPIVKSCRFLPAHVIYLVSDIMPFDIQLAFLEHIKCRRVDDTCCTGIFGKYTEDLKPGSDTSVYESGFVKLPSILRHTTYFISDITNNDDHFVVRLQQSSIRDWNAISLKLSSINFENPRNEFTVVVDGGRVLNSITTIFPLYPIPLDKDLTLNVIITRPNDLFTLNELKFGYEGFNPTEYPYPKSITVNYFMFDFTKKSITSSDTQSILYVKNNSIKDCLDSKFKDIVKFNIYTSGSHPLVINNVLSKFRDSSVTALSFESYDRYKTGDTLYNVNVPMYDCYPLVDIPDTSSEDNKHANFIFKRRVRKPALPKE